MTKLAAAMQSPAKAVKPIAAAAKRIHRLRVERNAGDNFVCEFSGKNVVALIS